MPSATRPPESTAAVPTALATSTGWRSGSTKMLVTTRSRSVTAAIAPAVTHGSGQSVKGCQRGAPSFV